ncbi:MAG: sensor histidine kinase [Fidelibacterota bacterium]
MANNNTEQYLQKIKHLENELKLAQLEKEETARKFYDLYNQMEDEVRRRASQIRDQNFKLQEEVRKRNIAEKNLKKALKEKEYLFRELHHRVKNNLQLISSIINLQIKDTKNSEVKTLLLESRQKLKSMALIHDFVYDTGTSDKINLSDYLDFLCREVYRSAVKHFSQIQLQREIEKDIVTSVKTALPCGLIINELLTNSAKHAFPGEKNGTIHIALQAGENSLQLLVTDDGIGMTKEEFQKQDKCLGLNLVKLLVENQLKGKLNFDGSNGTSFQFKIPNILENHD